MIIDDQMISVAKLPDVSTVTKEEGGRMFIGGLPADFKINNAVASDKNIKGCIQDISINGKWVDYIIENNNYVLML